MCLSVGSLDFCHDHLPGEFTNNGQGRYVRCVVTLEVEVSAEVKTTQTSVIMFSNQIELYLLVPTETNDQPSVPKLAGAIQELRWPLPKRSEEKPEAKCHKSSTIDCKYAMEAL